MSANIYDKLSEYIEKNPYPFHMPGHKRNADFLPMDLLNLDITEVEGVDNLHNPDGIIDMAQKELAKINKASYSFMCVNGGSGGVIASILATCKDGDKIILQRNSHISAYKGLVLSGAVPIYINPEITPYNICGGISIENLEETLVKEDNVKSVLVTSPTYEGFVLDIEEIARVTHKYNAILIVDETHGAHFCYSDKFPKSAMECGADISVQSMHKTLPALNQSAVLNINEKRVSRKCVQNALSMVQTTSPSYIMLATMDYTSQKLSTNPDIINTYFDLLIKYRQKLSELGNIELIGTNLKGRYGIYDYDISKLLFNIKTDLTGVELGNKLLNEYNIQIEMASVKTIILMTSVADIEAGFKSLIKALSDIDSKSKSFECEEYPSLPFPRTNKPVISPRQARNLPTKGIKISESVNKIIADFITPYPPGVPLIVPGEEMTQEMFELLVKYKKTGIEIMGTSGDFINIIEV